MICQRKVAVVCEKSAKRIRVPFLRNLTLRLLAAITTYQGRGTRLVAALTLSFVLHAANATIYWAVLHSLAIPASLAFAAIFYCLLSVLLSMPVSISGIGVRDAFSAALFGAYGLRPEAGVAFSWLLLVLGIPGVIVGGLIQVWEMFQRRRSH
jgi:hypothetical protein